jgi:hypothetical protein
MCRIYEPFTDNTPFFTHLFTEERAGWGMGGGGGGQLISNKEGYYRNIWDENSKRYLSIFYFPPGGKYLTYSCLKVTSKAEIENMS